MKKYYLFFMVIDWSVFNLFVIGKSMIFNLVGIIEEGRCIFCFDYDSICCYSFIIDKLGKIYIVENKLFVVYLR